MMAVTAREVHQTFLEVPENLPQALGIIFFSVDPFGDQDRPALRFRSGLGG
jgi:hypothetical protein